MKLCIAGTRSMDNWKYFCMKVKPFIVEHLHEIDEIASGLAAGPDSMGIKLAKILNIPVKEFKAKWELYGKAAGPRRNREMAEYCDYALIFWNGWSPGTKNMIENMKELNKPFEVFRYESNNKKRR